MLTLTVMPLSVMASAAQSDRKEASASGRLLGAFSQGRLDAWEKHGFNGATEYSFVEQEAGQVLFAQCQDSASGLVRKEPVNISQSPVIEWSWRVDDIYEGIDETQREGDDYPASLYVAVKTGLTMLSVRVLHYVWSSSQPQGSTWESAYTKNVIQVAVRSGKNAQQEQWYSERRNLRDDFKRYFGLDVEEIHSISLMTDCDNSDGQAEAYYGDIRLLPSEDDYISLEENQLH